MGVEDLKVAIIGAGLAGLSCAYELQRNRIKPDIYEKNAFIGEAHPHSTAILGLLTRPDDPLMYFKDKLNITITPLSAINKITHISPRNKQVIKGNLGYFFQRGQEKNSVKNQIFSKLKNPKLMLNRLMDYEALAKKYDYVVIATGNLNFTEELGCSYRLVTTYVRGAIVLGNFKMDELIVWINKDYCKNGYAYLSPLSEKKASLVLIVTDVNEKQIDNYWENFLFYENIKYSIIEEFKLKHATGYIYPSHIGNIYLTGGSRGEIEPFLGFGQLSSIAGGMFAARSIARGKSYDKQLKRMDSHIRYLYEFRKAFRRAKNDDYDKILSLIGLPGIKQITYDTKLDVIKVGGKALKYVNKMSKMKDIIR